MNGNSDTKWVNASGFMWYAAKFYYSSFYGTIGFETKFSV